MSSKTKAELLADIEALKQQIEIKDDRIKTLEYLLDAEERDSKAFRAAHQDVSKKYVPTQLGRVKAEIRRRQKKTYLLTRFIHYINERWDPELALEEANEDVILNPEFKKGYGKSSLYNFRKDPEFSEYFPN